MSESIPPLNNFLPEKPNETTSEPEKGVIEAKYEEANRSLNSYNAEITEFKDKAGNLMIGDKSATVLRTPMNQILGPDGNAAQIPVANFKVHKVKPGNAKGVLGFKNTTVGDQTYTQLVFKPFDIEKKAVINEDDLKEQPLLNLNGDDSNRQRERIMTSNMIANIADNSYDKGTSLITDENNVKIVKDKWYEKAQNAFKTGVDGKGPEVFGQNMNEVGARLVGGKSKRRRIQRRKSVRRRRMSNRKR